LESFSLAAFFIGGQVRRRWTGPGSLASPHRFRLPWTASRWFRPSVTPGTLGA